MHLIGQWLVARAAQEGLRLLRRQGVEGKGHVHDVRGTELELRWWCPTCDRAKYRLTVSRDGIKYEALSSAKDKVLFTNVFQRRERLPLPDLKIPPPKPVEL